MAVKKLKTLKDAFESGAFDKEPKGMKEGTPKEEALDAKQMKKMPPMPMKGKMPMDDMPPPVKSKAPNPFANKGKAPGGAAPFPPFKKKG